MSYPDENRNIYNNENDGYRWSYGGYMDPVPAAAAPSAQPFRKKGGGFGARAAALVLVCALAGGGAGLGGAALYTRMALGGPEGGDGTLLYQSGRPQMVTVASDKAGVALTPSQLYAANVNSCVGITVTTQTNFFGQISSSAASGSGFVLSADGYILTNYHVVESAAKASGTPITVSFQDGRSYEATLTGYEADSDIAILKIEATDLIPVLLGDSDKLVVGESVMAIGNPLGELDYSITDGIVSALDRLITDGEGKTLNMLQTNCAINPGNSGGPLFNQYGEVIGVATAKYTNASSGTAVEGLGFAIPINDVKKIMSDLIVFGYVTGKPYMGVQVGNVPEVAQRYGVVAGATIEGVTAGSAAEKAGLQTGDIITALDEKAIDSGSALTAALTAYQAGDTARLTVVRGNQTVALEITFDDKNQAAEAQTQDPSAEGRQGRPAEDYGDFFSQWPFGYFPG